MAVVIVCLQHLLTVLSEGNKTENLKMGISLYTMTWSNGLVVGTGVLKQWISVTSLHNIYNLNHVTGVYPCENTYSTQQRAATDRCRHKNRKDHEAPFSVLWSLIFPQNAHSDFLIFFNCFSRDKSQRHVKVNCTFCRFTTLTLTRKVRQNKKKFSMFPSLERGNNLKGNVIRQSYQLSP